MNQNDYKSLAGIVAGVVAVGLLIGAVPTGAQTTNTATSTPTPTAAPTPTVTSTPTATASPTQSATTTGQATSTTGVRTEEASTTKSAEDSKIKPDVVIEQWDDQIQVIVLLQNVPDNVNSFEVRGATMTKRLQVSESPPAGQGSLNKPAVVEVVVVYEDGSESIIHNQTFK